MRPHRACGIDDQNRLAVAGDGGGEGVPLVGGEVVGVFEAIGLAGQRRELHLHPPGGLVGLAEAQDAGGIVRVGAAGALSGAEGARSSCASGMPSPSLSRVGGVGGFSIGAGAAYPAINSPERFTKLSVLCPVRYQNDHPD